MEGMMNQLEVDFDYRDLSIDDRSFVKERALVIRETAKRTAKAITMMGLWLSEVKKCLPHGLWESWLDTEFGWSPQTARRLIHVYDMVKSNNLRELNFDVSALYLIAAPKTPEPLRREAIRRAESGERMNRAKVLELRDRLKERAQAVVGVLAEVIDQVGKDIRVMKASDDTKGIPCESVSLVIAFWQAIEILRHPYLTVENAAQIALSEVNRHDQLVWESIGAFAPSGMAFLDQATAMLASLTKLSETILPCQDAFCLGRAEAQQGGNERDGEAS
jgi:hypothetical protein